MGERHGNTPFKLTPTVAIGYALYFALYVSSGSYGVGAMLTFAIGGVVMLCIVAAMEAWIVRRRQRNRTDQTAKTSPSGNSVSDELS